MLYRCWFLLCRSLKFRLPRIRNSTEALQEGWLTSAQPLSILFWEHEDTFMTLEHWTTDFSTNELCQDERESIAAGLWLSSMDGMVKHKYSFTSHCIGSSLSCSRVGLIRVVSRHERVQR